MKKILFVLIALLFVSTSAFAENTDPVLGPYTTDNNSAVEKTTFGWNETPFTYLQFNSDNLNLNKDLGLDYRFKFNGTGSTYWETRTETLTGETGLLDYWQSLTNWDSVKQVGTWEVKTFWHNPGASNGNSTYSFNVVTPEPISMALFGLGAGVLGLAGIRRRKKIL